MRQGISVLAVVLVLVWSAAAAASSISGELQAGVVYGLEEGVSGVPLSATLALSDNLQGKGKLYFEVKGRLDAKTNESQLDLGQAYAALYLGDVDLVVGRQVISWGTVDAFSPTNYFARLSEDALLQGSLTGEPVTGVQAAYYGPNWTVTGVALPFFTPQELSPLMRSALLKEPTGSILLAAVENAARPERSLANLEWGLRAETMLQGWDLQFSVYRGFESLPGVKMVINPAVSFLPVFQGEYRRETYVGAAIAGFLGDLGVKAEAAYGGPEPFPEGSEGEIVTPLSQNEKAWQGALGLEYVLPVGNGLLVQGQYIYAGSGSLFSPYRDPTAEVEPAHYLMGRISYNFNLADSVEVAALYSMQDDSILLMPGFTYRLPQGLELKGTLLKHFGEGELHLVPEQVRLAVTYRF